MTQAAFQLMLDSRETLTQAKVALSKATQLAFPLGRIVTLKHRSNMRTYEIVGEVVAYGGDYNPEVIWMRNTKTGKSRKVNAPWEVSQGMLS